MVNYEAILSIIDKLTKINEAPCKKTLQKIVFLIEAKQVDLGCDYGIHFYGPYSSDLDFAVRELCDEGSLTIKYTPLEHRICTCEKDRQYEYANAIVDEIITEFAMTSASELELLATALYSYLIDKDICQIVSRVEKIKGEKYSKQRINSAIERLEKTGFLNS